MRDRPHSALRGSFANEAGSLCLYGENDALNFARYGIEGANRLLASQDINVAKRYVEGDLDLIVQVGTWAEPQIFDLICRGVPAGVAEAPTGNAAARNARLHHHTGRANRHEHAVSVGVPYAVETPQQVIPSLVWVERCQERAYLGWVSSQTTTIEFSQNAGGIACEGKAGVWGVTADQCDRASIDGMVESIAKIAAYVFDDSPEFTRKGGCEPYLMDFLAGLRIYLDDTGVWARFKEGADSRFCVLNVLPAAFDL